MLANLWHSLFYSWIVSEIVLAVATRTRQSSGKVADRGSQLILWIVIVSSVTACEWIRRASAVGIFSQAQLMKQASLLLMLAALTIRFAAIFNLGKSFSANVAIQDSQKVHRTGLYRFVRHPSYLGLLMVFLAIGLHSGNFLSVALAFLPTTAALFYRIHVEEAALREAFGEEYISYSHATKRLIPGVF